jgi:hypothetical protein
VTTIPQDKQAAQEPTGKIRPVRKAAPVLPPIAGPGGGEIVTTIPQDKQAAQEPTGKTSPVRKAAPALPPTAGHGGKMEKGKPKVREQQLNLLHQTIR